MAIEILQIPDRCSCVFVIVNENQNKCFVSASFETRVNPTNL